MHAQASAGETCFQELQVLNFKDFSYFLVGISQYSQLKSQL